MVIGDHLPDDQKEALIRANLIPGAVIYRFCDFTKPPKVKYLVVAQVRADTALLVINTDINSFIRNNQHLLACQVVIDQQNHPFLKYDSYVDCTAAEYVDTTLLVRELMADMEGLKGHISSHVRQTIIQGISNSYTICGSEIDQLVAALTQ